MRRTRRVSPEPTYASHAFSTELVCGCNVLTPDADDTPVAANGTDRPWNGITITFTGVEDKPRLSKLVGKLGGNIESALTISTTHVVAPGFGSPKYLVSLGSGAVKARAPHNEECSPTAAFARAPLASHYPPPLPRLSLTAVRNRARHPRPIAQLDQRRAPEVA